MEEEIKTKEAGVPLDRYLREKLRNFIEFLNEKCLRERNEMMGKVVQTLNGIAIPFLILAKALQDFAMLLDARSAEELTGELLLSALRQIDPTLELETLHFEPDEQAKDKLLRYLKLFRTILWKYEVCFPPAEDKSTKALVKKWGEEAKLEVD